MIPTSIDADGSSYNGCGYKVGYRLNSSGGEKDVGLEGANGSIVTGFIPVSPGDVVRIYGIPWYRSDPNGNSDGASNYFAGYDANFTFIGAAIGNLSYFYGQWENNPPAYNVTVADGDLTSELITFTLPSNSNVKYIRMSCCSGKSNLRTDPASAVITVNEEIK